MNEITRIHIAKVAYDVEVAAKKQLEKYIQNLEVYTHDTEVLADIEIRMTELLDERGVKSGGVITSDDVKAIREQLGEPYEFADEDGDIAVGDIETRDGRTFYRDLDNAVLGGVLSGIAVYFKVNPLWTRLIFILLTFISFGAAVLAYIILWIVVPPARTATEKLRQTGRPVTLDSIRELNASGEATTNNRVAPAVKRVFGVTLGITSLIAALTTLSITIFGLFGIFGLNLARLSERFGFVGADNSVTMSAWIVYGIVLFGLLLLAALFSLIAYAFLAQKLTKRMIVSGIIIIAVGLTSCATAVGIATTQAWRVANEAQSLVKTTKSPLPKEFAAVRSVEIDQTNAKGETNTYVGYPSIQYVVDNGAPRYELSALPGVKQTVAMNGETAKITLSIPNDYRNTFVQTRLTIYGPALTALTNHAFNASYAAESQASLDISATKWSNLTVNGGSIDAVKVSGTGSVDLGSTTVTTLTVQSDQGLDVTAGTVHDLTVSQPEVCPSGSNAESSVRVSGVTSQKMTYNNVSRNASTYQTMCAQVVVGNEQDNNY